MGAWGFSPFEDDAAADWVIELDDCRLEDRAAVIERALRVAVDCDGYLEQPAAAEALAAVAVVAGIRERLTDWSSDAPEFLRRGETVDLRPGVSRLAARAVDRIVGASSEWRELWDNAGELSSVLAIVAEYRRQLSCRGEGFVEQT